MPHGHRSITPPRPRGLCRAALLAALLTLGSTGPGLAQAPTQTQTSPDTGRAQALAAWQRANARVAEFPRGHADLLRWEARQTPPAAPPAASDPAAPLLPGEVLRRSLLLRPDLLAGPGMDREEQARRQSRWADHVRRVQTAWLEAVAAAERHRLAAEVLENARLGAELGQRMVQVGNWSQARLLREQRVETRAHQAWAAAALAQRLRLEPLARLMGDLDDAQVEALAGRLPAQLPALPGQPPQASDAQALALARWPGLDSLRAQAERARRAADLDPWDQAVDAAARRGLAADGAATPALPSIEDRRLFNNERIEHAAQRRAELLAATGLRRSQVREATAALASRFALARLAQDGLLAQQREAEQETLLRYNGMLLSTWDLLAAARERLAALDEAAQARLRYWQAEADWRSLLAGGRYAGADTAAEADTPLNNAEPEGH